MLASQWEDTAIHTNTHANATSLQSWPCWQRRLPGGRERKEGKAVQMHFSPNPRGTAALGSSVNPLGTVGSDLLVPEPSYNVAHQPCMKHSTRCFTLWFSAEGRWWDAGERRRLSAKALYCFAK